MDSQCPICNTKNLICRVATLKIPYFGEILQITTLCNSCNYRHADILTTTSKEPVRYEYKISSERDMIVRVVRSSSGIIKIPELGVTIEPKVSGEAFVSNVEGVLERVKSIALQLAESENSPKARVIIDRIERLKRGEEKATLIIEDPLGNSAIISKKAKKTKLPSD
ncbi:MAG: ZPR1 zinc finger domain-containing protein [Candidatus Thermoplasmatota archaeon]